MGRAFSFTITYLLLNDITDAVTVENDDDNCIIDLRGEDNWQHRHI